ncbi:hypothetical protein GCM10022254_73250 [Actinomadura meridiana]|uniref:Sugar phosphate isomerase n=1 Tax=Actinomadura meridiana TaxID=559626 RepID=A0ABP8CQ16_9ACTN
MDEVREAADTDPDAAAETVRAVTDRLPDQLARELTAATLRWDSPSAAATVDALADSLGNGVLATLRVAQALVGEEVDSYFATDVTDPADVLPHAVRLAARGDLPGGLLACVLTDHHASRVGWPDEWRALLRTLRAHPQPDAAFAARHVHTAEE